MVMEHKKAGVVLLIYSDPFHFPPTINAANILAEKGLDVHLIGFKNIDDWSQELNKEIKLINIGDFQTGFKSFVKYFKSIFFLRRYMKKNKISWLIGYDPKSVLPAFIGTRYRKTKWIYHQHDFWQTPVGIWENFLWNTERTLSKYADYVSFPQVHRAEYFKKFARLKEFPLIIFNGPRKKWLESAIDENSLISDFRKKFTYILIYQGGWSKYFALERLFDALALCKSNTALIMLGEEREKGLRSHYFKYIEDKGITERVYLAKKYIPYDELPGFTKYCDAAIGKLTGDLDAAPFNDRYLIGAANKITEYVACGLPVILQYSKPNKEYLKKYPIGILTDTKDKESFAKTIDELLTDSENLKFIKENNKKIFENTLNFDFQFQKIVDLIIPSKKIALLIYSDPLHFPPTINAANILSEKGFDVHLIGFENTDNWRQHLNENIKLINMGRPKTGVKAFVAYFKSIFFIRKYLKNNNIDCLISYDAKSVFPSFIGTFNKNTKWIYHQHDFWQKPAGVWEKFLWLTERRLTKHADYVSFPQIKRAEYFQQLAGLKTFPIIAFNGPRLSWVQNRSIDIHPEVVRIKNKYKRILIYQGGLSKNFYLENLISAVNLCKSSFAIILYGNELEKEYKVKLMALVQNQKIDDRVIFWEDYLQYDDLPSITMHCDIGIAKLTHDEMDAPINDKYLAGASNKIMEYMAAGLPIIAADSKDNRWFYMKDNIGVLCNVKDPMEIAKTIDRLLQDDKLRTSMGANNKHNFLTKYNFDNQFQKILDVIN
ncbi:MAG: glycosyl transferase [Chitinophagaceae bacterium]|nr:glycosyl transferase [Chitinophagaceae bacterium]